MLLPWPGCEHPVKRTWHLVEVSKQVTVIPHDDRSMAPLDAWGEITNQEGSPVIRDEKALEARNNYL